MVASRAHIRHFVVALILLGLVAAQVRVLPAAAADPDDGITELHALLGQLGTWTSGLAEVGKLAEPIPTVGRSAGSILGFPDLVQKAVAERVAAIEKWNDLDKEFAIDLGPGDGRTGQLKGEVTTVGNVRRLDLTLTVGRTLSDQPFHFANESPQLSLTSSGGMTLQAALDLKLSVVVEPKVPGPGYVAYVVADGSTPSLAVDVTAKLPADGLSASIGILGVTIKESPVTPGPNASLHLTGSIRDPDGDGRLHFTRPDGSAGELSDPSSLAGLAEVGLRTPGSGQISMNLAITAAPDGGLSLPGVNAQVQVSWPDIATGSPAVTATGLTAVEDFMRLSPRDLADLLAQLVTMVAAMQRTPEKNLDLPFLSGSLADAIRGAEALAAFLEENVVQPPPPGMESTVDPARIGEPSFVSIQQLVTKLKAYTGNAQLAGIVMDVVVSDYDTAAKRLPIELTMSRTTTTPIDLVPPSVAAAGTASYGATTLTDTSATFGADLVGRRVVAGSAGGTVASAAGNTLTLTAPWTPLQPANGSPYTINGPEVDAGAVNLANLLTSGGNGIRNANAVTPTAKVTPTYTAKLKFALDLQAPRTGSACVGPTGATPEPASVSCPYERVNPDGSHTIVTAEPLPVERLLIGTGYDLLTADFPIEAAADVFAKAGFLEVRVGGTVKVCRTGAAANCANPTTGGDPMVKITVKPKAGDPAGGYVPVVDFFGSLVSSPLDRLGYATNVRGYVNGSVSVHDAEQFLPGGATAGFSGTWANIGTGEPTMTVTDLSEILAFDFDPSNPQALLGIALRVLQMLDEQLRAGGKPGVLGQKIPLVDRSLGDFLGADEAGGGPTVSFGTTGAGDTLRTVLTDTSRTGQRAFPTSLVGRSVVVGTQVGIVRAVPNGTTLHLTPLASQPAPGTVYTLRSELADAISLLTASPPDSLQQLIRVLDDRLGGDYVRFSYRDVGGQPHLLVDMDWDRSFSTSTPIKLALGSAEHTIASATSTGTAKVTVDANLDLDLAVPLTLAGGLDAVPLKVMDSSQVTVDAQAEVAGSVSASLGPLSLALGHPTDASKAAVAKAHYSVGLVKASPAGTASSLTDFVAGVTPTINGYSGGVDCGAGMGTGDDLALCANLPMFVTANGTTYTEVLSPVKVRLPKTAAAADLFTLTGNVSGSDSRPRTEMPSSDAILEAFKSALLDFGMIGDGIDAFLGLIEKALVEASMNGKLPVAGADLQAGSDFIGDVRAEMKKLFDELRAVNGGRLPDVETVNLFLQEKFKEALEDAGANPENLSLAITCQLQASNVTSVTGTGPDEDGTTSYTYAVAAVGKFGGADVATKIGDTRSIGSRPATLDDDNFNTINWSAAAGAVKYYVLRQTGTGWDRIATVTGTTYADKGGAVEQAGYVPPTTNATLDTCPGVAIQNIEGVVLRADMGTGQIDATNGCTDHGDKKCLTSEIPLDIGVPGLSLRASREGPGSGGIKAQVGWRARLAVELSRSDGLALLTKDTGLPELGVGVNIDLDGTLAAELAFLTITAEKKGAKPTFAAAFQVDFTGPDDTPCWALPCTADPTKKLRLADFANATGVGDVVQARLDLGLNLDWLLKATADAALPGIQTRLVMEWNQPITLGQPVTASGLTIAFNEVAIDAGAFLTEVLGPIVKEIRKITSPLQPVVDTLYEPIPVLSDLSKLAGGGDVTIITLAKTFSTLADGPDLDFVDTVAAVIKFANSLPVPNEGESLLIPVGSFTVLGSQAFSTPATPDVGASLVSAPNITTTDLKGAIDAKADKPTLSGGANSETAKAGFAFPLLDNPSLVFNLLMNADVDLVTFDSGPLTLAFTWRQSFGPVYAPPPVFITLSGTASVTAQIVAGFDTYGLRKLFEEGFSGTTAVGILNGLYFKSTDDSGKPLPVVTFYGEIAAGAAVSAVIITVGVEGGVSLTVAFAWNDPNNDGKFRLFEFGQVALNNPICLFQVSGRIGVFLRVYITLGVSPFSVSFSFTLADVTLLDFSAKPDCEPPPPKLGGVTEDNETLVVFAGALGAAPRGHEVWHNTKAGYEEDVFKITQLHTYPETGPPTMRGVKVEALGISEVWEGPQYANLKRVVVDGRGYSRPMKITMLGDGNQAPAGNVVATADFTLDAVVIGGSGDDIIKVGRGRSLIDGGGGDDTISASDDPKPGRVSWIAGGPGNDSITTGDADAIVAGDSHLRGASASYPQFSQKVLLAGEGDRTVTVVNWNNLSAPTGAEVLSGGSRDGNDRIAVGLGQNTSYGNGGDDVVAVAADSELALTRPAEAARWRAKPNTIVLGTGSDAARGGSNDDTIWTATHTSATRNDGDVDSVGATDTGAIRNVVDTGEGNDTVFGGSAPDHITSSSKSNQSAHLRGGGGQDVLIGGLGTDQLFGGPGEDWVVAEPATLGDITGTDEFGVKRSYVKTPLPAGATPNAKLLVGGDHADRIIGGDGPSEIYGDRYEFQMIDGSPQGIPCGSVATGSQPDSTAPAEPTEGTPGRDLILGGAGVDKVKAGGADDRVETYGGDDLVCGQAGNDLLFAGDGDDTIWGGSGNDTAYGESGADHVYGNDGADHLYGGTGADVIEGNDGADTVFGGPGNDIILGGTRAAAQPDVGDVLYGDSGDDVIIGDNGSNTYPFDLDAANLDYGGPDVIYGGTGHDRAFGGLENDLIFGGAGNDHIQGNHGDDVLHGDAGEDQIIGGSSEEASPGVGRPDGSDTIFGGPDNDVIAGDNAIIHVAASGVDPIFAGRGFTLLHRVTLLDLGYSPVDGTSAGDLIHGDGGNDVAFGQGGDDEIHGDTGDDYLEGGPGADQIFGGAGEDDIVGGSSTPHTVAGAGQPDTGDTISGGDGHDVVLGDNGAIRRTGTPHPLTLGRGITARSITLLDLGDTPLADSSGNDLVTGGNGNDVVLGQGGDDRLKGNGGDDYLEGGPGADWLEGGAGDDDLVGGSYTPHSGSGLATVGQPDGSDVLWGGAGDDVMTGDNAQVLRTGTRTKATDRLGTTTPGERMAGRNVTLLDLNGGTPLVAPAASRFGADRIAGGVGVDVVWGQDGDDIISGGADDDYLEGNGGSDRIRGDLSLAVTNDLFGALPALVDPGWPGAPGSPSELEGEGGDNAGQDDIIGGSSRVAFRDGNDRIQGDGGDDVVLGDNGTLVRTIQGSPGSLTEARYTERYAAGTPAGEMTVKRSRDPALGAPTTRFCNGSLPQCEPVGAFGDDEIHGGAGDDGLWGQDGDDLIRGGDGRDEIYGEMGDDRLFGDAGDDVILGDRGGVRTTYLVNDDATATGSLNAVPAESFALRRAGSYDRRVDLLHDTDGNVFVGSSTSPAMPHPGLLRGGDDLIRGGAGHDQIHGGWGHDIINGDSGGDRIFGGDGADVIWGGKGCEPAAGECPIVDGKPNLAFRGTAEMGGVDRYVDLIFGGRGGPTTVGVHGADILDWAPRREAPCTPGRWPVDNADGTTSDPCIWLEMTDVDDGDPSTNQHHHGTDWIYGGWDRDIMQANVAGTGPNPGDRLLDWTGAFNLYSHCEADYGGFNDVRQQSPGMQQFLERLAWGSGAGQVVGDLTNASTSAHRETAIVYAKDVKTAGSGPAFPGTPGHFDRPVACESL